MHMNLHPALREARAILFDAGGTLVHPDSARLAAVIREQTGRSFSDEEMRRALRETLCSADALLSHAAELPADTKRQGWVFRRTYGALGFDEATCERVHECTSRLHEERHLWCELDPEASSVLTGLKAHDLKIGVISNTEDGRLAELLELVEIAHLFDLLIDSQVVGRRKPDAEIFYLALEQLEVEAKDAVYIGDLYGHDIVAAERVGMRAILIDPFDLHRDKNCVRIRKLGELIEAA
jgi:HAD superfamily hydrolase (TIGR01509 family)